MSNKSKNTEIEIKSVELNIAGNKLRLTLDQAKELKKILNDAFPDKQPSSMTVCYEYHWNDWPIQPIPCDSGKWDVTCKTVSTGPGALGTDIGILCLAAS